MMEQNLLDNGLSVCRWEAAAEPSTMTGVCNSHPLLMLLPPAGLVAEFIMSYRVRVHSASRAAASYAFYAV